MRTAPALAALALLHACLAGPAKAQGWQPFTSKEGRFTVLLPATPLETSTPGDRPGGPEAGRKFEVATSGWFLRVSYMEAAAPPSKAAAEKALDNAEAGGLAAGKAQLLAKKGISLAGHPGREYLIKFDESSHLRVRSVLAGSRLYLLTLQGPREQATSPEADRFFESFKLTGPPPAPPAAEPLAFRPFTCGPGGFTALMPGTPQEKQESVPTPAGPSVCYLYSVYAGGQGWMVCYRDLLFGDPDPQRTMAEMAKELAGDSGGTVVSEKVLPGEYPGREAQLRAAGSLNARMRFYLVGRRLYGLVAAGSAADVMSPDVDRFFESFKLMK
jgi:hypothetical protein